MYVVTDIWVEEHDETGDQRIAIQKTDLDYGDTSLDYIDLEFMTLVDSCPSCDTSVEYRIRART